MKFIDNIKYSVMASNNDRKSFENLPTLMPYRGYDFMVLINNKISKDLPEILSPVMYAHVCTPEAGRTLTFRFWDSPKEVAKMMVGDLISIFHRPVIYYTQAVLGDSRAFTDIKKLVGEEKSVKLLDDFLAELGELNVTVLDTLAILLLLNQGRFRSAVTIIEDVLTVEITKLLTDKLTLDSFSIDLDNDNLEDIFNTYGVLIKYMCKSVTLTESFPNVRYSTAGSTVGLKMSRLFDFKYLDSDSGLTADCFLVSNINAIMKHIKVTVDATDNLTVNNIVSLIGSVDINRSYAEYIGDVTVTEILKLAIKYDDKRSNDLIKNAVRAF